MPVNLARVRRQAALEQHRRTAAAYLADQEERFAEVVRAAFRAVFAPVLDRFATTITADAAGFASPDDLNTIRTDWLAEVEHTLAPMVSLMYFTGALSALIAHRAAAEARNLDERLDLLDDVLNRQAVAYLDSASNRLVGIGDTAWATARDELVNGFTLGEGIPDLAERVQHALDVAEVRAVTIARTEVVGASNAGSYDAVTALADYGPTSKQWVATVDTRTRETHAEADGQVVPLDEPFDIGGYPLDFPGDPAGPAEEVVNCRCTLIYVEPGDDPTDLTDVPGRGQGGPPDLNAQAATDAVPLAASSQETPTMPRRLAVRTRTGFTVPPPPAGYAPGDSMPGGPAPAAAPAPPPPPPAGDPAGAPAAAPDIMLQVPPDVIVRPFEVVLAVEGRWTGDGRYVLPNAIRWDGMLPLSVDANHDETVESTVGLIGDIVRVPGPNPDEFLIVGRGFFDLGRADRPHEFARFIVDRIESGVLSGASMSIDDETLGGIDPTTLQPGDDPWWMQVVEDCRLRLVTVCPAGAFAECRFTLDPEGIDVTTMDLPPAPTGPAAVTATEAEAIAEQLDAQADAAEDAAEALEEEAAAIRAEAGGGCEDMVVVASGDGYRLLAAAPTDDAPPADWFANPNLDRPTPLTIDDDGRIYGHLATWGTCHTGFGGQCITPPHSATGYAAFHTGEVLTREGKRVAVGRLTAGTGHASTRLAARPAAAHYDDTGFAVGDVVAGEDDHGIWVAGAVRPTATPEQVAVARSSPPSGDWRRIGTSMELVAALHVNSPGFPVPRARIASGVPQVLVAAGIPDPNAKPTDPAITAAAERIAASIGRDRGSLVAELARRVHPEES